MCVHVCQHATGMIRSQRQLPGVGSLWGPGSELESSSLQQALSPAKHVTDPEIYFLKKCDLVKCVLNLPVILVLSRWRQKAQEFKVLPGYVESLSLAWVT